MHLADAPISHFDVSEGGRSLNGTAVVRHVGILPYRDAAGWRKELVPPTLLRYRDSTGIPVASKIGGIPTTNEHPERLFRKDSARIQERQVGKTGAVEVYLDGDTEVRFHVSADDYSAKRDALEVIDGIRSGELTGVSLGYDCQTINVPGYFMGQRYDAYQWVPFEPDHMAHTRSPRAGRAYVRRHDSIYVVDHQDAEELPAQWSYLNRSKLRYGEIDGAFAGPELSFPIASKMDAVNYWASAHEMPEVQKNILAIAKRYGWADSLPDEIREWADQNKVKLDSRRTFMSPNRPEQESLPFQVMVNGNPYHVDSALYADLEAERKARADGGDSLELEYQTSRADALEIEVAGLRAELAERNDSSDELDLSQHQDAIAEEVQARLDAWEEVRPFLPKETKFDSSLSADDWYREAVQARFPQAKLDEADPQYIQGAFSAMRIDSVIPGGRSPVQSSTDPLRTALDAVVGGKTRQDMITAGGIDQAGQTPQGGTGMPRLTYHAK